MSIKPTKRKAFNFLRSYFDMLNQLKTNEDKLDFLMSIINKQFLDEDPEGLNFITNLCYESQRHHVEKSVKGWKRVNCTEVMCDPPLDPTSNPMSNPSLDPQEEEEEEEEKEEVKEKYKKENVFNFRKSLLGLGAEKKLVEDWLKVRKTKKAVNTETAFKSLSKQFEKSSLGINEILENCITKSWSGFNNQWLEKEKPKDGEFSI